MRVEKAGYEILTDISDGGVKEIEQIERIARVCYKSEENIKPDGDSAKKMIKALIRNGHLAMLEHSVLSVKFKVDRGVSHELVRHRMASFAQESTRYCNYSSGKFGNELTFIQPLFWKDGAEQYKMWSKSCSDAEESYLKLIQLGAQPQEARSVLPNSLKTEITVTANYREWRHIFDLRAVGVTGAPHPQMLEVMVPLLKDVAGKIPVVFDDLVEKL